MEVQITNGRKGTWYEDKVGQWFKVIPYQNVGTFKIRGTFQVDSEEYQLIIAADCKTEFEGCMIPFTHSHYFL